MNESKVFKIRKRGERILEEKSSRVREILIPAFQNFLDGLIRSGEEHLGVGIAAPQVGVSQRVFILAPKASYRYPDAPTMDPVAIINPLILRGSDEKIKDWEGCLSIPGLRGLVPRHASIDVAFTDRMGRKVLTTYEGFIARIFQHELDHLDGILYPDRMEEEDSLLTLKEFAQVTGVQVPN